MRYEFSSNEELLDFLNEHLLSTVEVAEILDVSKARVGQMVKDGKLRPAKNQPKVFLRETVLERKKEQDELRMKYRPYDMK